MRRKVRISALLSSLHAHVRRPSSRDKLYTVITIPSVPPDFVLLFYRAGCEGVRIW